MTAGWKLAGYVIGRRLGRGVSGEVWQARVARSGEPVALKRIPVASAEAARAACAEAALLASLEHPNLVRLHELRRADDALVLVLDLAAGGSLAEVLATRGRLTPGEAITALAPVAAALAYAHDAGVTHGDLSAGNVLFSAEGLPLLSDLGVARLVGDDAPVFGTPAYIDPAVAAGSPPTPASDLFMLGGVLLHALTGEPTWAGEDPDHVLARARSAVSTEAGERLEAAGIPETMARVACRALSLDPLRRGTAAEFALDLRHSGQPVRVELAAGRVRPVVWSGPRHAARPSDRGGRAAPPSEPSVVPAAEPDAPRYFDRPDFPRPAADGAAAGPQRAPLTRRVAPRPRPVLPRRVDRPDRRLLATAGLAALAVVIALVLVWSPWRGSASADAATHRVAVPTTSTATGATRSTLPVRSPVSSAVASHSPVARAPSGASRPTRDSPTSAGPWIAALRALDARRAAAFLRRDPAALAGVYSGATLRRQDAATLRRLVPAGCALTGLHSTYSRARVTSQEPARAEVTVLARLPRTELVCGSRPAIVLPGAGPSWLRVTLVRTAVGIRIAAQSAVTR
jgi:hypothetical protein